MHRSTDPSPILDRHLDRRALLRNGGVALSLGAIAAACGSGRSGPDAPGRLGVADPLAQPPDAEVDDVVLLRTAQSLEYTALDVYDAAIATGELGSAELRFVERFVADHTGHAALLGSLITDLGGDEFMCANPFVTERAVVPILGALEGSDDLRRDLLNIAHAFESLAGRSYQALTTALTEPALRREVLRIGGDEHRHAAALALTINPDQVVSPAVAGEPVAPDDDGFPVPYAIPSTFGRLTGIELIVGAPDADGGRFTTILQTPAANSLVYADMAC